MNERCRNAGALVGLVALSVSSAAWAGDGAGRHPAGAGSGQGDVAGHVFERMDENKDGQITREEAVTAAKRLFERLDQNGDGEITRPESEAGARAIREQELAARFAELDEDKDGRLNSAEAQVTPQLFQRLDTNKDRALSREEYSARPDFSASHRAFEFDRADANHDGKVTRDESDKAAAARFDSVDANRDGKVTRKEFDAHVAQVKTRGR